MQPIPLFADSPLITLEIHYDMPEAGEVYFVWGLNGWQVVPEELWPVGTEVKNNIMHTPTVQVGDTFVAKVWVPAGTKIDYGFRVKERQGLFDIVYPIWDGNYQEIPAENSTREVKAAVTLAKDLSDVLKNGLYFLVGVGVLLCTWLAAFFFLGFVDECKAPVFADALTVMGKVIFWIIVAVLHDSSFLAIFKRT
jgi:hypothetical protein